MGKTQRLRSGIHNECKPLGIEQIWPQVKKLTGTAVITTRCGNSSVGYGRAGVHNLVNIK